jgi:hypothetical protein
MKIQTDLVVYHIMLVKWPVYQSVVVQSVALPSWVHIGGPVPAEPTCRIKQSCKSVHSVSYFYYCYVDTL